LFVTAGRIGDAVLSTGLLVHLAHLYPQARFTVACGPAPAPLFEPAPFVERVIPMPKRRRAGHWVDLWRQTATGWWSLVVDLRGSGLSYLIPTARRRVLKSSWAPRHRLLHLASVLGLDQPCPPRLWATPEQEARAAAMLPPGGPVLALGPTANWGGKQWPAERFADLAARLTAPDGILPGARLAVFGGPGERDAAAPVLEAVLAERRIDAVGTVELPVAHALLKRADLYVGNDSGLMHMAAASGVPTLGLFGPSSEVFYGPWGPRCAAIRGPRSFEDICHAPDFDYRSHACLMRDLDTDRVIDAATRLWRASGA
jgi:ADP-heptose:LPS heptosyltransferase